MFHVERFVVGLEGVTVIKGIKVANGGDRGLARMADGADLKTQDG